MRETQGMLGMVHVSGLGLAESGHLRNLVTLATVCLESLEVVGTVRLAA